MDKFHGSYYAKYKICNFKEMTDNDIKYGQHLLLQIGRGGIDVYKIMKLSEAYAAYGYFWVRDRLCDNHVIVLEK